MFIKWKIGFYIVILLGTGSLNMRSISSGLITETSTNGPLTERVGLGMMMT